MTINNANLTDGKLRRRPAMPETVVSFDLDSTLFDTQHRRHHIQPNRDETDWLAYAMACVDDDAGPAMGMAQYLASIGVKFIITSRRDFQSRELTEQKLAEFGLLDSVLVIDGRREINLLLDPDFPNQNRNQGGWKVDTLKAFEARTGIRVALHVDDWADVTRQMLEAGIPAMTVIDHRPEAMGEYMAVGAQHNQNVASYEHTEVM